MHALLHEGRRGIQRLLLVGRERIVHEVGGGQVGNEAGGEIGCLEHADVVAVDRLGLLLVEAGRVRVDVGDVERGDELVAREDIAVGGDRPAEE